MKIFAQLVFIATLASTVVRADGFESNVQAAATAESHVDEKARRYLKGKRSHGKGKGKGKGKGALTGTPSPTVLNTSTSKKSSPKSSPKASPKASASANTASTGAPTVSMPTAVVVEGTVSEGKGKGKGKGKSGKGKEGKGGKGKKSSSSEADAAPTENGTGSTGKRGSHKDSGNSSSTTVTHGKRSSQSPTQSPVAVGASTMAPVVTPSATEAPVVVVVDSNTLGTGVTEQSLPIVGFEYETTSRQLPTQDDFDELAQVTANAFNRMYRQFFQPNPVVDYDSTVLKTYTPLASRLVKYDLTTTFNEGSVPSTTVLKIAADRSFVGGESIYDFYLTKLQEMDSLVFSTTTAFRFISDPEALANAQERAHNEGQPSFWEKNLVKIVVPLAVFFALIIMCCFCYYCKSRRALTLEEIEAMEEKARNKNIHDQSDATTYVSDYRTSVFSEDMISKADTYRYEDTQDAAEDELMEVLEEVPIEEDESIMAPSTANDVEDENQELELCEEDDESGDFNAFEEIVEEDTRGVEPQEVGDVVSENMAVTSSILALPASSNPDIENSVDVETREIVISETTDPEEVHIVSAPAEVHAPQELTSSDEGDTFTPEWMQKFKQMGLEKH